MRHWTIALALHAASLAAADLWPAYSSWARRVNAVAPTPMGRGHLGRLPSGKYVQIRFPLPKTKPDGFWVVLGNVVGFTGRGRSYQLVVRVDSADGPVVYKGEVFQNGDRWNASNRRHIDLSAAAADRHARQGYIDLFVTGLVQGDGWTLYRSRAGRPIVAYVLVLSPQLKAKARAARRLAERGVALIPMPREISLLKSDFTRRPQTRIVLPADATDDDLFAARDLAAALRAAGFAAPVARLAGAPAPTDIALSVRGRKGFPGQPEPPKKPEGYALRIDAQGAWLVGADAAGLFYAVQTARRLVLAENGRVRLIGVEVHDAPAFPLRGFQYDIARSQTVNVAYCKRVIEECARLKMNAVMFYLEDDFKFERYPFLGRPGTFTPAKARELTAFARPRHVQLIPQFESLGHAAAVLRHEELAGLREAGGRWVFCTSEPATWRFFDNVFGELAAAFSNSRYIHVGADEFEFGFAKCPRCKAKAAKIGVGGLYAEHMRKLDALVRQRGRRMLFWPSHSGPTPALRNMSLQYADKMPKDAIPTEWIYHGPASYPTIEQYQRAGYADVWCCPAVVGYSAMYPNYRVTFRGVSGFFQAGAARGCGGAMTTTWELTGGAFLETSWLGLAFSAECAWTGAGAVEFPTRFARCWFAADQGAEELGELTAFPLPERGPAAVWRNRRLMRSLFWTPVQSVLPRFVRRGKLSLEQAKAIETAADKTLARLRALRRGVRRNEMTFDFITCCCRMYRHAAHQALALDAAARLYADADQTNDLARSADKLAQAAKLARGLAAELEPIQKQFEFAAAHCGASPADPPRLKRLRAAAAALADQLAALAAKRRAGARAELPPARSLGLSLERYVKVGEWSPKTVKTQWTELRWRLPAETWRPRLLVELRYDRGSHGLAIRKVWLTGGGKTLAEDAHPGWTGAGSHDNAYVLRLPSQRPAGPLTLHALVESHGGTHSYGEVWATAASQ